MKKLLSILLSIILMVSICPLGVFEFTASAATTSGTCGENVTWEYDTSTYTLTISGTGAMSDYSWDDYNDTYVTSAPWKSYYNTMKTVIINSGVTRVGHPAFGGCTGLTSITIPNSVTEIGDSAFSGCTGLKSITIPDSLTEIGSSAFRDCTGLTSVIIGDSVTKIGYEAFEGCTGLTSVTIGNSVTHIDDLAFSDCTELTSITIPDSVTSIGDDAFYNTAWINSQPEGLVYAGKVAYKYKGTCPANLIIKDGTPSIAGYAFEDCIELENITIPDSVVTIGRGAFSGCTGLTGVTIPDGTTSIKNSAFEGCTGMTSVTIGDSVTLIGCAAFDDCVELASIVIPDTVNSIGNDAFYGCTKLASVTGGNFVTIIGNCAFHNTAWFDNQPDGLVYIGKVVYKCKGECPANVVIKDGTIGIADDAFSGCSGMKSIKIPDSMITIGMRAFSGCSGLTTLTIPDSVTSISDHMFEYWVYPFDDTAGMFYNCTGLTSVKIGNSVTEISDWTFSGCTGLTNIIIPNSVKSIRYSAFLKCTSLTDVYYTGTEQQKNSIAVDNHNYYVLNATWHYNYGSICEHNGVWKTVKKATFAETGLKQEICTECGKVLGEEVIPVLTETYSLETVKVNEAENIAIAVSVGSDLPVTFEVKAQKTEEKENSITYDIHLENGGEEIQPQAPVLVKLPIPAGFDKDKLIVYRKEANGSKTRMDIVIDGDYAYFETDHFSIYEIIQKICGDINGDDAVNNKDLTRLFQYLSDWEVEVNESALDINGDGSVNNKDLTRLFQYLSDWDVEIF